MNDNSAAPDNDNEGIDSVHMLTVKANSKLEAAARVVASIGLCPRDLAWLSAALISAVVDDANKADRSPFHHIGTNPDVDSPIVIAAAAFKEIASWGNNGEDIPVSALKDSQSAGWR